MTAVPKPLDDRSGHGAVMAEVARQCELHGDPAAANYYGWDERGLWRVQDRSEPSPVDIGSHRPDMQRLVEMDVADHVRLRRRRDAIGGEGEPAWAMAIDTTTRLLLDHVGVDAMKPRDDEVHCGSRGDIVVENITHTRGRVLAWIRIGMLAGTDDRQVRLESYIDHLSIRIDGRILPDTALLGVAGLPLSLVMPHPLLDPVALVVKHAYVQDGVMGGEPETMFVLEPHWEPLVREHDDDRPWLLPLPYPAY